MSGTSEQGLSRPWLWLFAAWLTVTAATLGSLFFSEVADVPVCVLCWYQRTVMYPLVLVLGFGLFPFDRRAVRTGLALVAAGWLLAVYHVLLVAGIVPERMQPCVQGIPCSETHVALFGFLDVPTLSLLAFTFTAALLMAALRSSRT